ncbi:Arc family DNA-binding protein [Acinetobacter cumulans]|uniref:Arc family DNA-binding protein n=1 Tax=Acinetobacter cumulans TaxID=2136182 RepID=UPI0026A35939
MARNDPQMNLRVPIELKEKIEQTALENGRTITAEAVYRLEKSFEPNFFRVTTFNNLSELGYTIEIDRFTFGLFKSQLQELRLYELHLNYWILSYHAIRCTVNSAIANELIEIGCKFEGSSVR